MASPVGLRSSARSSQRIGANRAIAGRWWSFGGTSASGPSMTGFLGGVNQRRKAAGKLYLGHVSAAIYELFKSKAVTV